MAKSRFSGTDIQKLVNMGKPYQLNNNNHYQHEYYIHTTTVLLMLKNSMCFLLIRLAAFRPDHRREKGKSVPAIDYTELQCIQLVFEELNRGSTIPNKILLAISDIDDIDWDYPTALQKDRARNKGKRGSCLNSEKSVIAAVRSGRANRNSRRCGAAKNC